MEILVSKMTFDGDVKPYSLTHSHAPKVGVVRSRDMILQYNVKVGKKTANINVKNLSV